MEKEETKEVTEERIEETQVSEDDLVALKGKEPLVKGFQNKTVIMPVALLQKRLENHESQVQKGFEELQKHSSQQMQYVFQYVNQFAKKTNELELALEAVSRLLKLNEDDLEKTMEAIVEERKLEEEKKRDKEQNLVVVDRPAEKGDTVKISFVGTIDGKEFDGGTVKGHALKLGSGHFIPGFEDQLVGVKAGDVVDVKVDFPADYANKTVAGKSAVFKTTLAAVKAVKKEEATTEAK